MKKEVTTSVEKKSNNVEEEKKYTLKTTNLIMIVVSFAIIVTGFILMLGEPSGATEYNPDIFSFRRITVGPMTSFFGFIVMVFAILYRPRKK